jgi:hypothetical protein
MLLILHDAFEDLQVLMLELRPRLVLAVAAGRWVPAGATTGGPGGQNRLDTAAAAADDERQSHKKKKMERERMPRRP